MDGAKPRSGVSTIRADGKKPRAVESEQARATNRIHCKEARARKRERERLLGEVRGGGEVGLKRIYLSPSRKIEK